MEPNKWSLRQIKKVLYFLKIMFVVDYEIYDFPFLFQNIEDDNYIMRCKVI
jgi:hypothetical protein